ncbi:MAG: baseplate J/gp47 family protein, partial [Candidatus Thiodiazotropha sp.]
FSIRDDTLLLPVTRQEVFVDGVLVSDRLERGESIPVMATRQAPGSITVEGHLAQAIQPSDIHGQLALAIILDSTGVAPQWDADAVDVPPPDPLSLDWSTDSAAGRISHWHDGTGGLRRSGFIGFALPEEAKDASVFRLTLASQSASHAAPPKLSRAVLGATIAAHRHRVEIKDHDTGDSDHDAHRAALLQAISRLLPISEQILDLPPALTPAIGSSLALRLADADGLFHDWHAVPDLSPVAPEERAFTFDRRVGRLSFGNGYTGRVPAPASNISLFMDLGGGPEGNHASGLVWRLRDSAMSLRLESLTAAASGTEPEALDEARARIAESLAERHRAVTVEDYATLVENTPGIGAHRAHVIAGYDPSHPCHHIADTLTVFVVPKTGSEVPDPRTDDGALRAIRERLETARMLTTRVFVRRPRFRPIALSLEIASANGDAEIFIDLLRPVISDYLHPAIGGPMGTGWDFGRPVRPSELLRVANAALSSDMRVERVAIRLIDTEGIEEDCTELAIGPSDLVRLDRLDVRVLRKTSREAIL